LPSSVSGEEVGPAAFSDIEGGASLDGASAGPSSTTGGTELDEWQGKLPEFTALVGGLTDLNPNSEDAQELVR
jgi:hypothetical protein